MTPVEVIYRVKTFFILMAIATLGWIIIAAMFRPFHKR